MLLTSGFTFVRSGFRQAEEELDSWRARPPQIGASAPCRAPDAPGSSCPSPGRRITHTPQPGAVLRRHLHRVLPGEVRSLVRHVLERRRRAASAPSSYTFTRIAACGQTSAHLLHWMQSASSQTGISAAMLRFSHFDVPVGHVPSTGNALTGSRSPWFASITRRHALDEVRRASGTGGGQRRRVVGASAARRPRCRCGERRVHRGEVLLRPPPSPRLRVRLFDRVLDLRRSPASRGSTPEIAKKHVCMIVLMRVPRPASRGHAVRVDRRRSAAACSTISLLHLERQLVPDVCPARTARSAGTMPPGSASAEHVVALEEAELMAGDERRA